MSGYTLQVHQLTDIYLHSQLESETRRVPRFLTQLWVHTSDLTPLPDPMIITMSD